MAEAAIAFTGFAASLVTLVAVVNHSCKTVYEIWKFYEDAPKLLVQVKESLGLSRALLHAIRAASKERGSQITSLELQTLWRSTKTRMENDFQDLNVEITRLCGGNKVKFYFLQDRIGKLQKRVHKHVRTLQLIKTMAIRQETSLILSDFVEMLTGFQRSNCQSR